MIANTFSPDSGVKVFVITGVPLQLVKSRQQGLPRDWVRNAGPLS
jgi:hypothetical protein